MLGYGYLYSEAYFRLYISPICFPSSPELKSESRLSWCLIHAINHSNIVISQCTDISTSSKLWPVVISRKYPIWLSNRSWRQTKSFFASLVSSHTWMVTLRLNIIINIPLFHRRSEHKWFFIFPYQTDTFKRRYLRSHGAGACRTKWLSNIYPSFFVGYF